jgi:2-polyprenyl-6-methoxyphenol hydroxylase-like FAD-dependent oxidoreductase
LSMAFAGSRPVERMPMEPQNVPVDRPRQAVVVGAGVAGLAAALTLAGRYQQVIVLDRDVLPDGSVARRGVPQGAHAHGILAAGLQGLEKLSPGLLDELVAAGAIPVDYGRDLKMFQFGAFRRQVDLGLAGVALTRPLLESVLRRRLVALSNVAIRGGTVVTGLVGDGAGRVVGVDVEGGDPVPADLVVDCSGRGGTRANRWLETLGFPVPETSEVKINVGYTTRLYRREPGQLTGAQVVIVLTTPPVGRVAALFPVEGDRWIVTLGGWHNDYPPTDEAGFDAFVRSLPGGVVAEVLASAEPISPIEAYRFPCNRRRHYERLSRVPAGYLVMGDALCSFNPIYGQGMSVAVQEAALLGDSLDRHRDATTAMVTDYYRRAAKVVDIPWQIAVGADFYFPRTEGAKARGTDLINRYLRRVFLATQVSDEVQSQVLLVTNLLAPPSTLLRPGLAIRALRAARAAPGLREPAPDTAPEVAV